LIFPGDRPAVVSVQDRRRGRDLAWTRQLTRAGEDGTVRTLVYTGFMSLDGVVDSPGGGPGEEHRSGGWVFKDLEFVPEAWSLKGDELAGTTALMFGRRSYEAFAAVWPGSEDHAAYKELPKYVVSESYSNGILKLVYDVKR
jgi:hypothetical protein